MSAKQVPITDPEDQASSTIRPASKLGPDGDEGALGGPALVEPPVEAAHRLAEELAESRDRYLRLAAEYDNFRKRTARERTETWSRAQADVVSNLVDALDDLGRVAQLDPGQAAPANLLPAVQMIERKMLKQLESAGLERVGVVGEAFDPGRHEAVGTEPAASADQDHVVSSVLQPGYRFGGALLRPARVRVYLWAADGEVGEGDGAEVGDVRS